MLRGAEVPFRVVGRPPRTNTVKDPENKLRFYIYLDPREE